MTMPAPLPEWFPPEEWDTVRDSAGHCWQFDGSSWRLCVGGSPYASAATEWLVTRRCPLVLVARHGWPSDMTTEE